MIDTYCSEFVGEYCESQHFLFLTAQMKEYAESLLSYWCKDMPDSPPSIDFAENKLNQMARFELPLEVKKSIPELLVEFYDYVETIKGVASANIWTSNIKLLEKDFTNKFRSDGTVKGSTFKKKYTDVGRNDPCPCGSGKKFKKCCLKLIS